MPFKGRFFRKSFGARGTLERALVCQEVLPQRRRVPKLLATRPARMRLFPRVPPQVLCKRRRLRKARATESARVRLFPGVAAHVLGKIRGRRKRARAPLKCACHAPRAPAPPRVHREQRPPRKALAAHPAPEPHFDVLSQANMVWQTPNPR